MKTQVGTPTTLSGILGIPHEDILTAAELTLWDPRVLVAESVTEFLGLFPVRFTKSEQGQMVLYAQHCKELTAPRLPIEEWGPIEKGQDYRQAWLRDPIPDPFAKKGFPPKDDDNGDFWDL